ncbi:SCO family protein [Niveispirillum sp. BGYR6]|uniref:SCO family protein n=1 Tax=Niveispirillum sp. BGYR6 TaxID=2971249 RepID=UPI0022B9978E|nr:SCO family protein [Niveispirillum sp. BGYR6]MDG5494705.1 SCO family protein [Niveispirillum sp. BGYR6]
MMMKPARRPLHLVPLALAGLALLGLLAWLTIRHDSQMAAAGAAGMGNQTAAVGGPFTLTDHQGRTVTEKDYAGRMLLIFFGYTYCPDICPTEVQTMAEVMDALSPEEQAKLQPLFITIDPARDNPQVVADYVALFHPGIVGLTGTPDQVAAVAKAYRVYYAKSGGEPDGTGYMMDHSAYLYLMGADGALAALYPRGTAAARIVADIRQRLPNGNAGSPTTGNSGEKTAN